MADNLVLIEHNGEAPRHSSLGAIALAERLGGSFVLAVLGENVSGVAELVRLYGARAVLLAEDPTLKEPVADRYATVLTQMARSVGATWILGTSSTFAKDVLPRAAALLDAPMVSDVTAVEVRDGKTCFKRPINAGSAFAIVTVEAEVCVLTARGTAFRAPAPGTVSSPVEKFSFDASGLPVATQFVSREKRVSARPDLAEARVVVSGGRPLKDKETFERLIGGLADALGGAVGATRAAVDEGMMPNDFQVGQTGKTVAPELYVAVGVSGAIQHMAGVQDAKVIVAINRDPEAPVFQMANYGLVGDLHEIVPRLIAAVRS